MEHISRLGNMTRTKKVGWRGHVVLYTAEAEPACIGSGLRLLVDVEARRGIPLRHARDGVVEVRVAVAGQNKRGTDTHITYIYIYIYI